MIGCYNLIIFPLSTCNITSIGISLLPNSFFTCSSNIVISCITCPSTRSSTRSITSIVRVCRLIRTTCTAICCSSIYTIGSDLTSITASSNFFKSCLARKFTVIILSITPPVSLIGNRSTGATVCIFHTIWSRIPHMITNSTSILSIIKCSCMLICPWMILPSSSITICNLRPHLRKRSNTVS